MDVCYNQMGRVEAMYSKVKEDAMDSQGREGAIYIRVGVKTWYSHGGQVYSRDVEVDNWDDTSTLLTVRAAGLVQPDYMTWR